MDPGFYYWLIIMFDLVAIVIPLFGLVELRRQGSSNPWPAVTYAILGILLAGEIVILYNYPHVIRGWERQVATTACILAGIVIGYLWTQRRSDEGGSCPS